MGIALADAICLRGSCEMALYPAYSPTRLPLQDRVTSS
jgi:hypothetical protein